MTGELDIPVPGASGLITKKGAAGMAADDQQITVHFVHPTDSTQVLTATVGQASTPRYLIGQLVSSNFLSKAKAGADYKLVDTKTDKELSDNVSLAAAGVAANTTLNVLHSVTGAQREPDSP